MLPSTYLLPSATDPEGAAVVITLTVGPTWMSISGSTLTMIPLSTQVGTNSVTVSISDGYSTVSYVFNVIVINSPPTFATTPATQSVSIGTSFPYTLPAITDPENDIVTVSLVAPLISFVSIAGTVITIAPPIITASGTSLVSGQLFDGVKTVLFSFNVVIANLPPSFVTVPIA